MDSAGGFHRQLRPVRRLPAARSLTACGGALLLVLTGYLPWREALFDRISWNVIGLFFGTLCSPSFSCNRACPVMAEWMVRRTRTVLGAMIMICFLSSTLSMFLENVAVVLLVAPVATSLCQKLGNRPVRLLILIAVCSNLQGTATLIGDPPSMILAGHMKLSFKRFLRLPRAALDLLRRAGGGAGLVCGHFVPARRHHAPIELPLVENAAIARADDPARDPGGRIDVDATPSIPDSGGWPGRWRWSWPPSACCGTGGCPTGGPCGTWSARWIGDTTFFLIGVFVVVGGLSESGWLDRSPPASRPWSAGNLFGAFAL
jgi:hypothetical protein